MAVEKKLLEETLKNPKGVLKDVLENKKLKEIFVGVNETIDLNSVEKILEQADNKIDIITSENGDKNDKKHLTYLLLKFKDSDKYKIKDGGVVPKDITIGDFIFDLNETPNEVYPPSNEK